MNVETEDINTVRRQNKLQEFIDDSKARLRTILKRLEWSAEALIVPGPVKVNVTQEANSEPELPPSYANGNFITLDVSELRKIVSDADITAPKKFSDLQLNFTRQQKLAIYEHVVANTEKCREPEATVPALGAGSLTLAEIVAEKKSETKKRRRYRQSKPTHLEEVRAVVDLQMQAFQQYVNPKAEEESKLASRILKTHKTPTGEEHIGAVRRSIRETLKHHKPQRSRSRSDCRRSSKNCRNRSRSKTRRHKHKKHKKSLHDRSSSRNRKKRKLRSRSCSKSTERKSTRRRSRSNERRYNRRSKSAEIRSSKRKSRSTERKHHKRRSRSLSRHRNKVH